MPLCMASDLLIIITEKSTIVAFEPGQATNATTAKRRDLEHDFVPGPSGVLSTQVKQSGGL